MPSVLSKFCLAPNQPWNFRWFHKLQHQTPLAPDYLQQSYKFPSLIKVAFNCLPKILSRSCTSSTTIETFPTRSPWLHPIGSTQPLSSLSPIRYPRVNVDSLPLLEDSTSN
ncbi:hypothetical protein QL285_005642 [Trifolium repens]|nr:hypothetical protein QL285_005642 [Trifolium repens]